MVLAIQDELELFPKQLRVEQVANSEPYSAGLVDVRGPDAAASRSQTPLFAGIILSFIEALVIGHDQVRGGAHPQAAGVDLAGAERS